MRAREGLIIATIVSLLIGIGAGWGLSIALGPVKVSLTPTPAYTPTPTLTPVYTPTHTSTPVIVKENYMVVIDDLGRVVYVPRHVERVVLASSGVIEIIYALGCGDKLVGRDHYSSFPPQVEKR